MADTDLHQGDKLLRYALGDLSVEESEAFKQHLAGCGSCQEFVSFVMDFNGSLRSIKSDARTQSEAHPDSSLIVAQEAGELSEDAAAHVRAHVLYCKSCLEEFLCLRGLSQPETWSLVEKLRESLIDLGATYGPGALRGLVQIVSESPALAFRGQGPAQNMIFKVIEVTLGHNIYSIEIRTAPGAGVSCDIAGFQVPAKAPLHATMRTEAGAEVASLDTDKFGNGKLTVRERDIESELYVLTLNLQGNEQDLLFRLPER
jgi:hypothetical protein